MLYKKLSLVGIALSSIVLINIYPDFNQAWNPYGQSITGQNNDDYAGYSVALSTDGTILAEGEPYWNNNSGRVRIFKYTGGSWSGLGEMDGQYQSWAGWSVALSTDGTVLAEGEWGWSGFSGRVRIFQYTGGSWSGLGEIDGQYQSRAGWSVALSTDGTVLAEGEIGWSGGQGQVSIYQYTGGSWEQLGSSILGNTSHHADPQAGSSVTLSSDGKILAELEGLEGLVYVFQYTGGSWSQLGTSIPAPQTNNGINPQNISLSSNGKILAIGEPGWSHGKGQVSIYEYTGDSWSQLGLSITDPNYQLGGSLALNKNGTIVAIGGLYTQEDYLAEGQVFIYQYTTESWEQLGASIAGENLNNQNDAPSVALDSDGNILAIGSPFWSGHKGQVRVFKNPCITGSTGSTGSIGSSITYYASSNKENVGKPTDLSLPVDLVASIYYPVATIVHNNGFIKITSK